MPNPIIHDIASRADFYEILKTNPGIVIIKLGAEWCKPCKVIEKAVYHYMEQCPNTIQNVIVDSDNSFDFYAFLKKNKMVNGIPALLCYYKENLTHIPDDSMNGADFVQLQRFFESCCAKAQCYDM